MPRHACLGATSACAFSPSPPTHHASPPSPSPCLLLVHVPTPFATHTHSQATPPSHTHTHAWWLVHFGAWCVCVCPRCWLWPRLARHSHVHPLLVPHTTPLLLLLLLLLVVVDVVVAAWVLWRVWPLGPLTGCAGAVHSRITHTHTRGDGHVVVVAVCVVWLPPPLCAFPTNHHHCVRCPALSAVCVSGGTTHTRPLWCHPRWCVCVSERRGHHTHHPRCRPMCPLSPLTRHATPATLSQMPRLTSLTPMACFVWLLPSTHTHTGWLTAHTPSTHHHHWVCVCSSTCSHPPHTHTHTGRTGVAHAWVVAGVVTTTTPLVPHHHTHTHTAGLVVWAMVVLGGARVPCVCLPRHHHTRLPSHHHHHQRSCATTALTHTRDLVHAPLPHTHATCTTTHTKACCVLTTPCHTHHHPLHPPIHSHTPHGTHTRHQPHCHNGACHRSPRRPLTHTADATHTPHRRQTKAKHTTGCGFS